MTLNQKQIKHLKGLAHHLDPVVTVGKNGFTESVANEVEITLSSHELIKVRISADDRSGLYEVANKIAEESKANLVQVIGHIAVLYRIGEEPVIRLPH